MSGTGKGSARNAVYVLPALLFVVAFFLVPLAMCAKMSLWSWPLFGQGKFVGIANFRAAFGDAQALRSFGFTCLYTILVTPAIFLPGFALALMVNSKKMRCLGLFRTIYFMPVVIGLSTSSVLWLWLLNDRVGAVNALFQALGIIREPVIWLGGYWGSLASVVLSVVWKTVGFSMILILAGLQAIPDEIYESAKIDGCGYARTLGSITLPLLRRTLAMALLQSLIGSFLAFDQFYIMTAGRPANSTITSVYWIYVNSFQRFKLGYGAALSMIFLCFLFAFCAGELRMFRVDED